MKIREQIGPVLLASALLVACGEDLRTNRSGDIVAGLPAKVEDIRHYELPIMEDGPFGYTLYMDTEDCPKGRNPSAGLNVTEGCTVKSRRTDAVTYWNFRDGVIMQWSDVKGTSEVQKHGYSWERSDKPKVYAFRLLVEQCVQKPTTEKPKCITDFVKTDINTWQAAERDQVIVFSGVAGTVISGT